MSTLATNAITDAAGGNTATINGYTPTVSNMAGRNRIINGDMRIDQRNAGAAVTAVNTGYTYSVDRFAVYGSVSSKFTAQQNAGSVTPPAGFTNYLGITSSSAYSVPSGELYILRHGIEGLNIADLGWGTVNAKPVTLSFWVRSSLTGTFGGSLRNNAADRSYPFNYTISSANTWEQKSVTIAGETTGTWLTNNGLGIFLFFGLGVGSDFSGTAGAWASADYRSATGAVSVVGTSGATFYITGVQLEEGSVATPFERRQYGQELALCQRYAPVYTGLGIRIVAQAYSSNSSVPTFYFPVATRVPPTGITVSSVSHFSGWNAGTSSTGAPTAIALNSASSFTGTLDVSGFANNNLVAGNMSALVFYAVAAQIIFTGCEL